MKLGLRLRLCRQAGVWAWGLALPLRLRLRLRPPTSWRTGARKPGGFLPTNQPSYFTCTSTSISPPPPFRSKAQALGDFQPTKLPQMHFDFDFDPPTRRAGATSPGGFYQPTNQPSHFTYTSTSTSPLLGQRPKPGELRLRICFWHFDFDPPPPAPKVFCQPTNLLQGE